MLKDAYGPYIGARTFPVCSGECPMRRAGRPSLAHSHLPGNIAMYGDTQGQVLEDMLEAVKQLAATGFMLNLRKSQLV